MKKFELVIPAYNESKNLKKLIDRVIEAAIEAGMNAESFNLVLVENGSTDNSAEVINKILKEKVLNGSSEQQSSPVLSDSLISSWVKVVKIDKNQGYGFGLMSGLKQVHAEYAGWTHADLQCDPKNAFRALQLIESAPESKRSRLLIKGIRLGRNWKDVMVSRVFEALAFFILGLKVHEMNAQPKVFSSQLISKFVNPPKTFAFDLYGLYQAQKAGFEVQTIDVLFPARIHGVSNWAGNFFSRYKTILGIIKYMISLRHTEGPL